MLGKTYDSQVCSAARALELVGERWTLLIVRDALFVGATRYSDFMKGLDIATNILKSRLDGLVDAGIMERRRYSQDPDLYEYPLTDKGRELVPSSSRSPSGATGGRHSTAHRSSTATRCVAAKSVSGPSAPTAVRCMTWQRCRHDRGPACLQKSRPVG
jgi:DNA-binding HxlR family transcriptional regulator